MYAKVINPKTNGKKVYSNKGSSQRCANYLVQEAKEEKKEALFFGTEAAGVMTADGVVAMLDNNVKGLAKETDKFHSLVLSPSSEELAIMGNDTKGLQEYTRNVMDLYAKNFTIKGGRELGEPDLVWAALIHQDRKNRGTDEGAQGEKKEGLQTHIHVMVSARDAEQKITLNPLGTADRFNRVQFQAQAVVQMQLQFGTVVHKEIGKPAGERKQLVAEKAGEITSKAAENRKEKKPLTPEQLAAKDARLDVQVGRLNSKLSAGDGLDPEKVKEAARARGYDMVFYATLGRIERAAEAGNHTVHPYQYLTTGRVGAIATLRVEGAARTREPDGVTYAPREKQPQIQSSENAGFERSISKMMQAMKPKGRAQDVRSEAEQQRDSEMEM